MTLSGTGPARDAGRLSAGVSAALAAPGVPLSALSLPLVIYLPEFYAAELGLGLATVGTIFMTVRLLDIGFDPVIGAAMDRTRTRIGRYRPWLLLGTPMIMAAVAMLFMARPGVGTLYLGSWLLLAYAGWSILSLAQLSLAANITQSYQQRSRIYAWWQMAFMTGAILAMLMPKIMQSLGYSGASAGMRAMAWLVIVITPLTVLVAARFVAEQPAQSLCDRHGAGVSAKAYFVLFRNPTIRRLLMVEGLLGVAGGSISTLMLIFFTRVKHIDRVDVGLILLAHFVLGLATTPLWTMIANRVGKHRALMAAATLDGLVHCAFLAIPAGQLAALGLCYALTGIAYGATSLLPRAMMADISDEEQLQHGVERSGLLFALLIGVWKIGQAVSVGLMFVCLSLLDFNLAPGAVNAASASLQISLLFVLFPACLKFAAAATILRYPLTASRHAEIRRKLDARRGTSSVEAKL